jgi:hypothetical protein
MSVLGHLYVVFLVTFVAFCHERDAFNSYNAIERHAQNSLAVEEYVMFVISDKEEVGCFEAHFGKQSYTTIVCTVVWLLFCKACVIVAAFF